MSVKQQGTAILPLQWESVAELHTIYANQLALAHSGSEFYLVFGEVVVPVITSQSDVPSELKVRPKVKLALSHSTMEEFYRLISQTIENAVNEEDNND